MIGTGRLVIFVDDLDRCLVENAFRILEAVKLFLNAKGVIFVFVDMKKIERAWELRYRGLPTGTAEGREHVDKIFQFKLSLPPKEKTEFENYLGNLPRKESQLIIPGCLSNPWKMNSSSSSNIHPPLGAQLGQTCLFESLLSLSGYHMKYSHMLFKSVMTTLTSYCNDLESSQFHANMQQSYFQAKFRSR